MEQLESRVVLDGNVRAFISGGALRIEGDSRNNEIVIEQTSLRNYNISSRDGSTLINGQTGPRSFFGVRGDLRISLHSGNDVVEIVGTSDDAVTVSNRLSINTGNGSDQVLLTEVHAIGLHLNTGSGNDTVNVGSDGAEGGLEITKEAIILTGSGQDVVSISNSLFKRFLTLELGSNNDEASLLETTVRKRSNVIGGAGFDIASRENNTGSIRFTGFNQISNTVQSPAPIGPVAVNDTAAVVRGGNVGIGVAANDTSTGSALFPPSIVITQQPTNGTAVADFNGTVTYTNNGAAATSDTFRYTIRDQAGNVSNVATVTVTVNAALAGVDDPASITEDATPNTTTGNVLTNDTGGVGTKAVTAVNGAAGSVGTTINGTFGTFRINADGSFTYSLDNTNATVNALNAGQTLTDTMAYTVAAGGATATATLRVTIQGATDALNAVDDAAAITENATPNTATGNVITNDTGGGATKVVSAVNGAAGSVGQTVNGQFGTFNIAANGTFTYTLNNNNATVNALAANQTLTDSLPYTLSDGTSTDTGTLTVTITGVTDTTTFTAIDDAASVTEDASPNTATGSVLTNDTGGGATKTVTAVNGTAGNVGTAVNGQFGTFLINQDGSFTYTLDNANATVNALAAGSSLTDLMPYTSSDGTTTSTATLRVTIQGAAG